MEKISRKKADFNRIICPFCFHEFSHEQVVFRSNAKVEREDTYGTMDDQMPSETDLDSYFRPFDSEDANIEDKKIDEKLAQFWESRGGVAAYPQRWEYPHIDPADKAKFHAMIHHSCSIAGEKIGEDGFVRDDENFVLRVVDKKSDPTDMVERLCPNCHNPLSLQEYGKYPTYFISVVGVTNAGKTVFLTELLTTFSEVMRGTGFRLSAHNLGKIGKAISPKRPLPEATDDKVMRPPLIAQLTRDNPKPGEEKGITLVFYDIAGENCVNENGDTDEEHAKATIGNFIKHCDAMILLVDPEQLPCFADGDQEEVSEISQVASVMSKIRQGSKKDPHWTYAPVAVTISKSDKIKDKPGVDRTCILYANPSDEIGYDAKDGKAVDKFLAELLSEDAGTTISDLDTFRLRRYFAVSAITTGVISHFEKYQNDYILSDDDQMKFDTLKKWLKNWNKRTPENRKMYGKCTICQKDGSPIEFDPSVTVTKQVGESIETEIVANSKGNPSINLTVWDVLGGVNLIGYPKANPQPKRIEDPLKWILWQLELIGPRPTFQQIPKKGFFETTKHWTERKAQILRSNEYDKKSFYGRPTDED